MATALAAALRRARVVMLLGAEGSGKTALAASQSCSGLDRPNRGAIRR